MDGAGGPAPKLLFGGVAVGLVAVVVVVILFVAVWLGFRLGQRRFVGDELSCRPFL